MECFTIATGYGCYDVNVCYNEYGHSEPTHLHEGMELMFIVSGQGENIVNGKTVKVKRGSVIIVESECFHCVNNWETMKYYSVLFKTSFLDESMKNDENLRHLLKKRYNYNLTGDFLYAALEEDSLQMMEELFLGMIREELEKRERYIYLMRCYFDGIMNLILREAVKENNDEDLLFSQIVNYIGENSAKNLRIEDVAERFNYNSRYISNKLKEYCGLSFKQLIMKKRLDNVIYCMSKTDESIEEICIKCGFTNKAYFYDLFEKTYGIKPKFIKEYKKNYEKFLHMKSKT